MWKTMQVLQTKTEHMDRTAVDAFSILLVILILYLYYDDAKS